jgi:hypothetical protein
VSPARLVVLGALVAKARFDDPNRIERLQLDDLSNGTALSKAFSGNDNACDSLAVNALPAADFIWMSDISASTKNDRGSIANAAGIVFDALSNNGVDFRMGVVPDPDNRRVHALRGFTTAIPGELRSEDVDADGVLDGTEDVNGNGVLDTGEDKDGDLVIDPSEDKNGNGVLDAGFTRDKNVFIQHLGNERNPNTNSILNEACEFGLTAADDAIKTASPRTAAGVEDPKKLRSGALLVVFYVGDEHAQEIEEGSCGSPAGSLGTGVTNGVKLLTPSAAQQAAINGLVAPFVTFIQGEGGIAFGQIGAVQAPFCSDSETGRGYFEAINALGGSFYRPCDANPGATLQDIIDVITGAASELVLSQKPISATLKVGLTRAGQTATIEVPRSLSDGFDYDASSNTIFFRGQSFRPNIGDVVTVSYRLWLEPQPPVSCDPPLVLNPVTQRCECPGDCGLAGGCGAGFLCNTDPAVCACECPSDCGGVCAGNTACDSTDCSCDCLDTAPADGVIDCGGVCTGNTACDAASCGCVCGDSTPGDGAADCNGNCVAPKACNPGTCACECPADCGGCPAGEVCNPLLCACEDIG